MYKRVLALDGGGARGFFTYDVLHQISMEMGRELHQIVDLMVGTSVGAIIAAAFACGLMSNEESKTQVLNAMSKVFEEKNREQPFFEPVYKGQNKRDLLRAMFKDLTLKDTLCPLAIVTSTVFGCVHVFQSWPTSGQDRNVKLYEILDAASAAPTYFEPVYIQGQLYIDGGIVCNTPLDIAVTCIKELYGKPQPCTLKFRILSIGNRTAPTYANNIKDPKKMGLVKWMQFGLLDIMMGVNDDRMVKFIQSEHGDESVLRICGEVPPCFDNISEQYKKLLHEEALRTFERDHDKLLHFFESLGR